MLWNVEIHGVLWNIEIHGVLWNVEIDVCSCNTRATTGTACNASSVDNDCLGPPDQGVASNGVKQVLAAAPAWRPPPLVYHRGLYRLTCC